LLISDLDKN